MNALLQPELVGRYHVGTEAHFLPISTRELTRAAEFLGTIIDSCQFAPGRAVLLICQFEEAAQFIPLEEALTERGLILTNAEASIYDGSRAESVLRRFDVAGVIGINGALLDSLANLNVDLEPLLAGKIIWARPDAYERLAGLSGFTLLRYLEVGPTLALECVAAAGAHLDAREWAIAPGTDGIEISSRLARAAHFDHVPTGLSAKIDRSVCDCGLSDPRISL